MIPLGGVFLAAGVLTGADTSISIRDRLQWEAVLKSILLEEVV